MIAVLAMLITSAAFCKGDADMNKDESFFSTSRAVSGAMRQDPSHTADPISCFLDHTSLQDTSMNDCGICMS